MNKNISIKLKAAFLVTVFSLNTVIGFACAMGLDMKFNSTHHHSNDKEILTETLVPAAGNEQHHHEENVKQHQHVNDESEEAGCCNHEVLKFQNLNKNFNQKDNVALNAPVFVVIHSSHFGAEMFRIPQVFNQHYIFDFFHPPPPDIRILIQSFQI
jgi:ABC-type nickel/cobalt efflux system permease component RcnA